MSATERELERADEEDSGRGLEFLWINGEFGYQYVNLTSLSTDELVPGVDETDSGGLVYGGALGFRLLYFTLGARFRLANFEESDLWSLLAEGGLRFPLGSLEPYANIGFGFVSMGSFQASELSSNLEGPSVDIRGFDLRGAIGADYYLGSIFSVGAQLSGDLLFLTRPAVDPSNLSGADPAYAQDGSSAGTGFAATGVIGLHF